MSTKPSQGVHGIFTSLQKNENRPHDRRISGGATGKSVISGYRRGGIG